VLIWGSEIPVHPAWRRFFSLYSRVFY